MKWLQRLRPPREARDRAVASAGLDKAPRTRVRELFSDQQLRDHARQLSGSQKLLDTRAADQLAPRLLENEVALDRAFQIVRTAAAEDRMLEPAAEWLVDNFYVIKEQIKEIRTGLPRSYRRELPVVAAADGTHAPRIQLLMQELAEHSDGRIHIGDVRRLVAAYQERTKLTLGELWAIPLMLRFALIECLRPLVDAIVRRLSDTASAALWAERMLAVVRTKPADLVLELADMARARPSLSPAWVAEFHRRIAGGNPALNMALVWLEQQLGARHLSVADALEIESRAQAAAQVSVSNCVAGLRLIGRSDWAPVVESLSSVDDQLSEDPAGIYSDMDFTTRDRYRHVVEGVARRAHIAELEVARRAVMRAATASTQGRDGRARHVGYWLVGDGRRVLEHDLGARHMLPERIGNWFLRRPSLIYVGQIVLLTVAVAVLGLPGLEDFGPWHSALIIVAMLFAASHVSVAVVNWLITLRVAPQMLCRLALQQGIPDSLRSLVAVPCMLASKEEIKELVAALEIRYLANRDDNLYFALVTDFNDADAQSLPSDAGLLKAARAAVDALNTRYKSGDTRRFLLFHRARLWNPGEGVWMGHERKRGKLAELNRLLRRQHASSADTLRVVVGDIDQVRPVKYVITLDADTELPPQSAMRLVATMAHPLNRPRFDARRQRVVEGYGVLQPRVSVGASRESASTLARLHSDEIGLDPYTRVVSDVYQDLFGEASFIGKGIYDVDAFARATGARFPENLILSHDLLEGSYARTGLVSDVELFEHHPDRYSTEMRRRHRWIRGDWQVAFWLLPWVPGRRGHWVRNTLSAHHRWKILDNLRRSLVPVALLLVLLNGWLLSKLPLYWTAIGLGVLFTSPALISIKHFLTRNRRMDWRVHFQLNWEALVRRMQQTALQLVMLPFEALHHLDAVVRSVWRVLLSHRQRLQWIPSSETARRAARGVGAYYRMMWTAPVLAVVTGGALLLLSRGTAVLWLALPILLLWLLSPWIACVISRPRPREEVGALSHAQRAFLGAMARRTWHFFDHFVDAESHFLPPDNFQEYPSRQLANRTSPTNIGMYLSSAMSAADFGYISASQLLQRVGATLDTLDQLERYRGHFFNWYDTQTLEPLPPAYVSTVDSGNLLGCLFVVARGLSALDEERLLPRQVWRGLRDSWRVFLECKPVFGIDSATDVQTARLAIDGILAQPPALSSALTEQARHLALLRTHAEELSTSLDGAEAGATFWLRAFREQCAQCIGELEARAPWLRVDLAPFKDADTALAKIIQRLQRNPSLRRAAQLAASASAQPSETDANTTALLAALAELPLRAKTLQDKANTLAERCRALCNAEFGFLISPHQRLLSIGYNVDDHTRDSGAYDLLASEARLTSFVAIAQGRLPRRHWFALGRLLTLASGKPALVSWSGSMFEYLMPLLWMPSFDNTLLTRTCRAVIERQMAYAREHGVPWGISESAYNMTDANLVYQYRAFGVPGLGLKRGLADDLVITPYASAMAVLLSPDAAARNLEALHKLGASGRYGFYEAVDYTPARVPVDADFALVRAFMAHHQGMILGALSSALNNRPMQRRFLREPMFRANQLLLQEKVPAALSIDANTLRAEEALITPSARPVSTRVITRMDTRVPQMQLLSNGRYHVLLSQTGGGYSQWRGLQVNHWREDATCDGHGMFCYVQDLDRDLLWSNTLQPTLATSREYAATFAQASAEFHRRDHGIETWTRIAVSSEDDIELRRVRLSNRSGQRRRLALTSYLEWAMSPRADVESHPVFNKLFVETEFLPAQQALLARRRARSSDEKPPVFLHLMGVRGQAFGAASHESRRDVFLGRQGSRAQPQALDSGAALDNVAGAVLDPVAALRREVVLEPGESATVDIVTGAAVDRDAAIALVDRYVDRHLGQRVFDLAWTREQVIGHQLSLGAGERQLFARLASSVLYADPELRTHGGSGVPVSGQSGLWKYGISGDLPIVLLRVSSVAELPLVKQALQAHVYWHMHGLRADLVIWNEDASGYRQELHDRIMGMIGTSVEAPSLDRPGGVFVRRSEHVSLDDRSLLLGSARMVLDGRRGSLADQAPRIEDARGSRSNVAATRISPRAMLGTAAPAELEFFNGSGGYAVDGSEYVIWLPAGQATPRPWVNVLANPEFGSVVSERGGAYTFSQNAHEFRLTPWYNDPVTDESGEAFYLRDETSGASWSPTPWPMRGEGAYVIRHGFGYSSFHTVQAEIESTLTVFVGRELPLKYTLLKLRNNSRARRSLSVFGYVEWVLGEHRSRGAAHIRTTPDRERHAVYAVNPYNDAFARAVGWFATSAEHASGTGSRGEFIGRNRTLHDPVALHGSKLEGSFGAALDPCAAWQTALSLAPGEEVELVFVLGAAKDAVQARQLVRKHVTVDRAREELVALVDDWRGLLGRIRIETPDPATNLLANGWLAYQVIACRLWARSGFYQSGGAFGFRDQLQDAVSLLAIDASFAREQILRCAAHQFAEGDVQHWWHPPHGRGVRTNFSDDYLWLPWAVAQYVETSGDSKILEQSVPFLEGRPLGPNEESYYDFAETGASGSIYEHCRRALLHGLRFGEHGLPLIGAGDWNDGMNRVGRLGRGESVWLGFFLVDALRRFAPLAQAHGDDELQQRCMDEAAGLAERIDANAWDGAWYRRAYTDDGVALGSAANEECQMDSLPQSWAALTGVGSAERRDMALDSALHRLVRPDAKLVQLFDPPFDDSDLDPGYIKGYIPGTRENGGQYTHAAVWLGMACAHVGRTETAWNLLDMINPINHARDAREVETYRVEPYVVAADVYWAEAHRGLGGWTWYTGSAGWMYRFILESLLGVRIRAGVLQVTPSLRADWPGYRVTLQHGSSHYVIKVRRGTPASLLFDGKLVEGDQIAFVDDDREHQVEVVIDDG